MSSLAGKQILLVEDEALIAFAAEDILFALGCKVVGPAMRLDEAERLADSAVIDAAILDVNLNELRSYPVAARLAERGIPFAFASGYDQSSVEWTGEPVPILAKPYRQDQIERLLIELLGH